jgi:hypothetical protein
MSNNQTKRTKFVELCNKRVSNAIHAINLIGNLSSRSSYDYDERDVKKIFDTLEKELLSTRNRFEQKKETKQVFTLE